jgi:hypothetical protein
VDGNPRSSSETASSTRVARPVWRGPGTEWQPRNLTSPEARRNDARRRVNGDPRFGYIVPTH